jgi:hypothetical protein
VARHGSAAWRCCTATEVVAAPCDGYGSGNRCEHGGDRRVCALRLFRVSPAEKKLGVCHRGRRPYHRVRARDDQGGEDQVVQLETAALLALVRGMCVS